MGDVYLTGIEAFHRAAADTDQVSWLDDEIRILLLKSTGPPTFVETHATVLALLAHANNTECNDASYARDTALAGKSMVISGALVELVMAKGIFSGLDNETVGAAVVFAFQTDDTNSPPISFHDFTDKVANGSDFEVRWNSVDGNGRVCAINNAP